MHGRIFTKGLSTEKMQVCTHNQGRRENTGIQEVKKKCFLKEMLMLRNVRRICSLMYTTVEPQINEVAEDWVNWFVKFEGSLNQKTFWVVKSKFHCI